GRRMHEDPDVPNEGRPGRGLPLRPGMALANEPAPQSRWGSFRCASGAERPALRAMAGLPAVLVASAALQPQ
ncbi:hypothetical protein ABZ623_39245, partial [Streptomyces sp. NPDC007206]